MIYDDDKAELPHSFQVQKTIAKDTKILTASGDKIYRNPEPIGFVAPKHYSKFTVKPS